MLEGLEIREVCFSTTLENKDFRIDTDFWTKEPKLNPNLIYGKIGEYLEQSQYGISIAMNEENKGYPIYRMNEIHNMLCDFDVSKHADITNEELAIFELRDRDVLFNRTNSFEWVGRTGLFRNTTSSPYVFASYLVRFVPDQKYILPEYLTSFLNSKYGIWDVKRRARQSINQTNVNPEEVKEIFIPLLNLDIQGCIKENFDLAINYLEQSQQLYTQAEELLLEELGLKDWQPSQEQNNIKLFGESFLTTGRLDAEYYQPEYDDYLNLANNYKEGAKSLEWACQLRDMNYIPKDNLEYKYIELANIGKSGQITDASINNGSELPSRARRLIEKGDVLISSIEGSLSSCALVTEEYDGALCSTGFYIIKSSKINSETLLVLFKSELMQNLLKQGCSGTILTAINKNEFLKLPIPLIDKNIQNQVSDLITESFSLMKKSEHLLEIAKQAVETAIEENETIALGYIKEKMR